MHNTDAKTVVAGLDPAIHAFLLAEFQMGPRGYAGRARA